MRRALFAALLTLLGLGQAAAQPTTLPDRTVWGRIGTGTGSGPGGAVTFGQLSAYTVTSAVLDTAFGSTRGSILERGASGWQIVVPGTINYPWVSGGAGADPTYTLLTPAGGGTGIANPTAHAVLLGEGSSSFGTVAIGTAGRLLIDQGAAADPAFQACGGDCSAITAGGAFTMAKLNGVAYGTNPSTNTVPVVTGLNQTTYGAVPNAALANSAITLNAGASVGLTTPGAMSLGSTYTIGATTDKVQLGALGLGVATPVNTGQLAMTAGANGVTLLLLKRNTDLSPTGNFIDFQQAGGASIFTVNIAGNVIVGGWTGSIIGSAYGGAGTISGALKGNGSGTVSQAACADLSNSTAFCSLVATPTSANILVGNGSAWISVVASGDVSLTSAGAFSVNALHSGAFANPTASIGLTAVNGVATTAPRSDSAPALSQAITPNWTGIHTFQANTTMAPTAANTEVLTVTQGTLTANTKAINISGTWNNIGVAFDAPLFMNITNTASAAGSLLADLQVGGVSQFKVAANGAITINAPNNSPLTNYLVLTSANIQIGTNTQGNSGLDIGFNSPYYDFNATYFLTRGDTTGIGFSSGNNVTNTTPDTILTRGGAAATLQMGTFDAAAPIAQTFRAQSVVAGTTNAAGQPWTFRGSLSSGNATPGDIIFQTGTIGASGTQQNAAATSLTLRGGTQRVDVAAALDVVQPVRASHGYTVAGLPAAGTAGRRAYVTDQLTTCAAPGAALTGGGAVTCPVFDNGTTWVGG